MALVLGSAQYIVPLTNTPQLFDIELGGQEYSINLRWNDSVMAGDTVAMGWVMDILDQETQSPIACNIPFVTGADLLSGLEYLEIPGQLIVYTNGDQNAVPTLDNLGVNCNLYFFTDVPT